MRADVDADRVADFKRRLAARYAEQHGVTAEAAQQRISEPDDSVMDCALGMIAHTLKNAPGWAAFVERTRQQARDRTGPGLGRDRRRR